MRAVFGHFFTMQRRRWILTSEFPQKQSSFIREALIYLPRHASGAAMAAEDRPAGIASARNETILLVEEEPAILKVTEKMLTRLGYKVLVAGTASAAMQLAAEKGRQIQLLITDVIMPEMNGRDLSRKIQAAHPGLKVLYMSGYTADVIGHHGVMEAGVDYIQKPFSKNQYRRQGARGA